jgi:hypothetical protein
VARLIAPREILVDSGTKRGTPLPPLSRRNQAAGVTPLRRANLPQPILQRGSEEHLPITCPPSRANALRIAPPSDGASPRRSTLRRCDTQGAALLRSHGISACGTPASIGAGQNSQNASRPSSKCHLFDLAGWAYINGCPRATSSAGLHPRDSCLCFHPKPALETSTLPPLTTHAVPRPVSRFHHGCG